MIMKYKRLKNISDKNITDYPIAEAETDNDGNVLYDDKGNFIPKKNTMKWTIEAGETLKFPEYVANILLARYGIEDKDSGRSILVEAEDEVKDKSEPVTQGVKKDYTCRYCGVSFKGPKGLALHMAAKHPEKLK
jgi:hypothetical protein